MDISKKTGSLKLIAAALVVSVCSSALIAAIFAMNQPDIAFVRSSELVYEYAGMKEAQERYKVKQESWKKELDSLQREYREKFSRYSDEMRTLSKGEREARERILAMEQQSLEQYQWKIQRTAEEEDKELTQGVLNQINSFVEKYAREKGYDLVLGTTSSGNLLYGEDAIDITSDVLEAMNAEFGAGEVAVLK